MNANNFNFIIRIESNDPTYHMPLFFHHNIIKFIRHFDRVINAFARCHPCLRHGLYPVIRARDGAGHAGDRIRIAVERDGVQDRPFERFVFEKVFDRLHTM